METFHLLLSKTLLDLCSYPTYEEWKLGYITQNEYDEAKVLILPMRNGNNQHLLIKSHHKKFLSYL